MNRSEALAGYTLVGQETDAGLSLHRDSTVALALRIRINDQSASKFRTPDPPGWNIGRQGK
ncbi:MAG: hypothetical protein JO334_17515 [Verrucomicrobia bacterium]|nr:hypothetical protein [Verrucomicrobiota bacterium]